MGSKACLCFLFLKSSLPSPVERRLVGAQLDAPLALEFRFLVVG
jgi:hypothetical protein